MKSKIASGLVLAALFTSACSKDPVTPPLNPVTRSWEPMVSPTMCFLYAVWGAGNNAFAAGEMGTILFYSGSSWSTMTSNTFGRMSSISGSSPTDVYAGGSSGEMRHYDGSSWATELQATPNSGSFNDIWVNSAIEIYATINTLDITPRGIVQRKNTSGWLAIHTSLTPIYAVWSSSATDIFVVGGAIERFNGANWTSSPTSEVLWDVWGSSATNVYAVGNNGTIIHYNGAAWSLMNSPVAIKLNAVWGLSGNDVFAVGVGGIIIHYNGSNWRTQDSGTTQELLDVGGSASDDVFIVGAGGVILRLNTE